MVKPIVMPKYGLQQDEGTVIRWLKREGDRVKVGEALLELETDKAVFEYESPEEGVLRRILAEDGAKVPVLSVIGVLTDTAEEPFDAGASPSTAPAASPATAAQSLGVSPAAAADSGEERVKSSPAAKKVAKDLGVDLAAVKGTGPGGRITREDVEAAASKGKPTDAPAIAPVAGGRAPISRMRQAIGRAMSDSKRNIPHFYLSIEVDMTDAEVWRKRAASDRGVRLSVTDLLVKAAAMALLKYPALNASVDGDVMVTHGGVNVGLAVGVPEGLLVPVIGDAHAKSLTALSKDRTEVVEAARAGKLRVAARATFTLSNLGMFGVTSFIAIINPPESASMAVGAIIPHVRPVGEPLAIAVRQVMQVTLSADHRLADGMLAAQFLQDFKKSLECVEILDGWL